MYFQVLGHQALSGKEFRKQFRTEGEGGLGILRLLCAANSSSRYATRKLPEKSPARVAGDRSIVKSCSSGSPANQARCFVQPLHPLKTLETNV